VDFASLVGVSLYFLIYVSILFYSVNNNICKTKKLFDESLAIKDIGNTYCYVT